MIAYSILGLLMAVGSYAQVVPFIQPIQLPVFQYPGLQFPVGFGVNTGVASASGVSTGTGLDSRFGGGDGVSSYVYSSQGSVGGGVPVGTTIVSSNPGGTYVTSNQGGVLQSRFSDDDGYGGGQGQGFVTQRFNPGSPQGVQSSSTFVSSNNGFQQSSSSVTKDGLTTTYHTNNGK